MNGLIGAVCFATGVAVGSLVTSHMSIMPIEKPITQEVKSSKQVVQEYLDELITEHRAKILTERSA